MQKIIDAHSHYMPPEVACNTTFFKVHWSDIERQLKIMDENGIEKAVLLYPTSDAHLKMGGWLNLCRAYNKGISDIIAKHESRFIGAGILPMDHAAMIPEILKQFEDLKLQMISLASSYEGVYLDDDRYFPIFEFAQKVNMPIYVHPQIMNPIGEERVRDPLLTPVLEYVFDISMCIGKMMMGEIFVKFPDVNFIFSYYGGVLPIVKDRFDNTYKMLRGRNYVKDLEKIPSEFFKNLYFDTSGSKSQGSLQCMLEVTDSAHILWGSDLPANQDIAGSISVLDNSGIAEEEKQQIYYKNLTHLFSKKEIEIT